MDFETKCENCGKKLAIKTEETVSSHLQKMFHRAMKKFTIMVLCGGCGEWTKLTAEKKEIKVVKKVTKEK